MNYHENVYIESLDESLELYRDILYDALDTYAEHECIDENEETQKQLVIDLLNMMIDAYELIFYTEEDDE